MHCLPVDVECQATVVLCGGSRHVLLVQHQPTGDPIVVQCLPATKRPSVQCGGSARGGRGSAGARANLADHVRGCGCGLGLVVVWWCWVGGLLGVVVIWQDKAGRAPVPYLGCLFCPPLPQRCLPFAPKVSPLCPKGVSPLPKRCLPFAQKASPLCPKGVSPLPQRCLPFAQKVSPPAGQAQAVLFAVAGCSVSLHTPAGGSMCWRVAQPLSTNATRH